MTERAAALHLPLFPLPNVVHFPQTELRLHVFEPRYRLLLRDLAEQPQEARWIGMVLLKPGWREDSEDIPPIFAAGTAGRLQRSERLPGGSYNLLLRGGFRFAVEREVGGRPYRQALVRPLPEPELLDQDPGILAVRREILQTADRLAAEMGERFPLAAEALGDLRQNAGYEELVNRLAAEIDVPILRKLQLLGESLPERALNLLGILRSRRRVLDLLRPFRHLAPAAESN